MQPNLFTHATSELSQDAFLCWLLSWAAPSLGSSNSSLHSCAMDFLSALFEKAGRKMPAAIEQIELRQQDAGIDVLCIVNGDTAVLIEDKTGTQQHSDQLLRYKAYLSTLGYSADKAIAVYVQTGDQSDYSEVKKHGYAVFDRADLLRVLDGPRGKLACGESDILADFTRYLCAIEDDVQSYAHLPLKDWTWNSWKGFYTRLQQDLGDGGWNYVPNPSGGFLGFWWHFLEDDRCERYLQLEEEKFCFKISVSDPDQRGALRSYWSSQVLDQCAQCQVKAKRPERFGNGEYMTVAILDQEYRATNANGVLDLNETIRTIRSAEAVLDACAPTS